MELVKTSVGNCSCGGKFDTYKSALGMIDMCRDCEEIRPTMLAPDKGQAAAFSKSVGFAPCG